MNEEVVRNIDGYGGLIKARTKFVHSQMYIFTDWEVLTDGWLVPVWYQSQCYLGERQRNVFRITGLKFLFQRRIRSTCSTQCTGHVYA